MTLPVLAGCADMGYYWQAAAGHWGVISAARPVEAWLDDARTGPQLRERLRLAQAMRSFASETLGLPDNVSYRRYADLGRSAVVWNVVAAPTYSLSPHQWCFAVVGCVSYRGYFREADAHAEAARLRGTGWETELIPVPAYSTLGWTNWVGGDPLLNTFIHSSEGDLARLIFHELAHQLLYAADDTAFNESFATVVERVGARRWLDSRASPQVREADDRLSERRQAFRLLARQTRVELAQMYARTTDLPDAERAQAKAEVLARFRAQYRQLRGTWGLAADAVTPLDRWVERANNASFAAQGAYDDWVPALERLLQAQGGDLRRFYDAAKALAALPRSERAKRLKETVSG